MLADCTIPMIAAGRIGRAFARLLIAGWKGKQTVELGFRMSPDDLVRATWEASVIGSLRLLGKA